MNTTLLLFYIVMIILFATLLLYNWLYNHYTQRAHLDTGIPLPFSIHILLSFNILLPLLGVILSIFFLILSYIGYSLTEIF